MAIKLYGIPQSRSLRCLWLLEELGVPYENVPTSFVGDAQKPDFLKLNPNGKVPALDDDGLVLFESLAINLHLAAKYGAGKGLWPSSQDDRSRAIQWSIWAMAELEPHVMRVLRHRAFLPEAQRVESEAKAGESDLRKPLGALGVLEGALRGRPYLLGDRFTVADLNVDGVFGWLPAFGGLDLGDRPNLVAWHERCAARPAFARAQGRR